MKNAELIYNAVTATFNPVQIHELVTACYSPEYISERAAKITIVSKNPDFDPAAALEAQLASDLFHTYNEWKSQGMQVKRGEHAAIVCSLWKYTDKPGKAARAEAEAAGTGDPESDPHFYLAKSHLFCRVQVEKAGTQPAHIGKTPEEIREYNAMLKAQREARKAAAAAAKITTGEGGQLVLE